MRSATLLSVAGLIIGLTAAQHAEAASPGTVARKSTGHPSALVVQVDDDDDDGRSNVRRRAPASRHFGHGVRRYDPGHHLGVYREYPWTYRSYHPTDRKYVPRRHWRGNDDDD
jgi:hypothetical protein